MNVVEVISKCFEKLKMGKVVLRSAYLAVGAFLMSMTYQVMAAEAGADALVTLREKVGFASQLGVDSIDVFIYLAAAAIIVGLFISAATNRISWGAAIVGVLLIALIVVMAGSFLDDATTASATLGGGG